MYKYFLLLFLNLTSSFKLQIVKSPILNFYPHINQHHIVVLYNNYSNIYTIDFSPTNQKPKTLFKLFIGKNIDSIIRIKKFNINDNMKLQSKEFIKKWENATTINYNNINDIDIKNFLYKYYFIKKDMNLYNYNCQHFSKLIYHDYIKII